MTADGFVKKGRGNDMEISICIGSSCHLKGSHDIVKILQRLVSLYHLEDQVELKGSFCMGECTTNGVCVDIDGIHYKVTPLETEEFFKQQVLAKLGQ